MKITHLFGFAVLGMVVAGLLSTTMLTGESTSVHAADAGAANADSKPVEEDMHEFMEYVFQPAYKRLRAAMAVPSKDNQTWKTIKSDGLILAEGGNLLLIRPSTTDADSWNQHSVAVRELGSKLYRAARKKDEKATRQYYTAMLIKCNSCHQKFADGKHQLTP